MKVAIVHDWLTNQGGAERVVYELHMLYPDAPIYTSVYDPTALPAFNGADVRTSFLQHFPLKHKHQLYAALRPLAFRKLDLQEFDVIISSCSGESKQIVKAPNAIHICYCHTPIRYYWNNYDEYKANPGLGALNPLVKLALPILVPFLRKSDYKAAQKVSQFVANSEEVKGRIKKYYDQDSLVIHPPVDTKRFEPKGKTKRSGFVIAGRQTPYKRFDLAVAACTELELDLTVIGGGPENSKLKAMAGPTVKFLTNVSDKEMPELFQKAEAFIFPALEDFGIVPVEAMSAGTPVIAYGKGGALDYVVEGKTGLLFKEQTVESLKQALKIFDKTKFGQQEIISHAQKFSNQEFAKKISSLVKKLTN